MLNLALTRQLGIKLLYLMYAVLVFQRWNPISPQQRHGSSIVEVYRIVEEARILYFILIELWIFYVISASRDINQFFISASGDIN